MGLINNERKIKMNGAGIKRIYLFIVLALQLIAYPIVVFGWGKYSYEVYYGIIVACFFTSLVFVKKDAQSLLQIGACLFTCAADYCLILEGGSRLTGMWFFLTVQAFYAVRTLLVAKSKKERIWNGSTRVILSAFMWFIAHMVLGEKLEVLFIVSLIYYVNLVISIVFAFLHFRGNELLAIGLLLFSFCDLFIGLNEVIDIFEIPDKSLFYKIVRPPFAVEATFYCPSQVLLSLSGVKTTKKLLDFVKNSQS